MVVNMEKGKVLLLFPRFGIGGIAKSLSFVANSCDEDSYSVWCISMSSEEQTIVLNDGIKKIYCPYTVPSNRLKALIYKMLYIRKLKRLIGKIIPDVLVCFGTDKVRIAYLCSRKYKIPIIGSERGNPYVYTKRQSKKYIKYLSKCNRVVFQTEGAKEYYPSIIKDKSIIIPNPATQRFVNIVDKQNRKTNHIVVCSRLSSEKRVVDIVKAYLMSNRLKKETKLVIYGDGPEKEKIKSIIHNEELNNNVLMMGNISNVFEIECNALLFVLYSDFEGMPNSLIEAMGVGIPCIASDCPPGGVRYVTNNGERAALVKLNDIVGLSKMMETICFDKEVNLYYSKKSLEINDVLNPDIIKKKWLDIISRTIKH